MNLIIKILADGNFHSGETIGEALGISRAAVWKRIAALDEFDIAVESVKGKGYRLEGGRKLSLLDENKITAELDLETGKNLVQLSIHQQIDSTNTFLMNKLSGQLQSGLVCLAEQQTAGRGRRGREWVSPFASSIYLSVSQVFHSGAVATEGLSLAVGVMVADALADLGLPDVQLKWPNDVYCQGKKLAGILLELVGDAAGECAVVVGVGLNVDMDKSSAAEIDQAWTNLNGELSAPVERNDVVVALLNKFLPALNEYEKDSFAKYKEVWSGQDYLKGSSVMVSMGDNTFAGIAGGVNDQGALVLQTPAGEKLVNGGEVSVRKSTG